jgi:hypothetical protein
MSQQLDPFGTEIPEGIATFDRPPVNAFEAAT